MKPVKRGNKPLPDAIDDYILQAWSDETLLYSKLRQLSSHGLPGRGAEMYNTPSQTRTTTDRSTLPGRRIQEEVSAQERIKIRMARLLQAPLDAK